MSKTRQFLQPNGEQNAQGNFPFAFGNSKRTELPASTTLEREDAPRESEGMGQQCRGSRPQPLQLKATGPAHAARECGGG